MNKKIITVVSLLVIIALVLALNFFVINSFSSNSMNRNNLKIIGDSVLDKLDIGSSGRAAFFDDTTKLINVDSGNKKNSDSSGSEGSSGSSSGGQGDVDNPVVSGQEAKTDILVYPLNINNPVYGLAISGNVYLPQKDSLVRIILVDSDEKEYLDYESYPLIADSSYFYVNKTCEETCFLEGVIPAYLKIQLINSNINISSVDYSDSVERKSMMIANSVSVMEAIEDLKIEKMNENIQEEGMLWVAGETSVSGLSYEDKKALFGVKDGEELPNLQGFEYYSGGIFEMASEESSSLNSSSNSMGSEKASFSGGLYGAGENISLPDSWDWRTRHGENWNTPVKCQDGCFVKNSSNDYVLNCSISKISCPNNSTEIWKTTQTCLVFSATAASELLVNLYFNQHLNLDISEQERISKQCDEEGYVSGCEASSSPDVTFGVYSSVGAFPEDCFPYFYPNNGTIQSKVWNISYSYKCAAPNFTIKLNGHNAISSTTQEQLKRNIIENASIAIVDLNSLGHAMALIGYGKVKNGSIIYTYDDSWDKNNSYDIINSTNPKINETYWIFKNSFGDSWGEGGYLRMIANGPNLSSFSGSRMAYAPVTVYNRTYTVSCNDKDNDTYCNWGLFSTPMPTTCPVSCYTHDLSNNFTARDCDDSNSSLGGFDSGYNCIPIDRIAPYFTTIPQNININYTQGFGVQFNATDETGLGNYVINWTTLFIINQSSGWLTNSTPNIGAGTYLINVTVNDSSGNKNSTIWQVTVNPIMGNIDLLLNNNPGDINLAVGGAINASAKSTTGQTMQLLRNGVDVTSENNIFNTTLVVGYYNYTANALSNQNYSLATISRFLNITCTALLANTTPTAWQNQGTCLANDTQLQNRSWIEYDSNSCGEIANVTRWETNITSCDFCTPNLANITGAWTNLTCLTGDKMNQTRSITQYDTNSCGEIANQTFVEYRSTEFCDFCTPNLINSSWSNWLNTTCSGTKMNQSRFLTQYDNKSCGEISNQTIYDYQLVGPSFSNTTWTNWLNITSCQFGDYYNQSKNLTQFDSYSCSSNQTFFEFRNQTCDFCTPNLINSTKTAWQNQGTCLANDTQLQNRSWIEYDSNSCGEIANVTRWETNITSCDFCTPNITNTSWSAWSNQTCSGTQMNQSQFFVEYDNNACGEISNITHYNYQLVGPIWYNTTWSDWLNTTCSNSQQNQSRFLTQSDIYSCGTNSTIFEYRAISPPTETCNGIDDNCDGIIDNGLTAPSQSCSVGIGACQRIGTQIKTCNGASGWSNWGACSAIAGTPTIETCNGIDDNCNGQVDEGLTQSQSCNMDVIACSKAGSQIRTCSAGSWGSWSGCSPITECSDSDYGNNIYAFGITKGILLGGEYYESTDRCIVTTGDGGGYWVDSCTGPDCAIDEAYCRCCEQSDGANCGTNMYGKYFVHKFPYYEQCPNGCAAGRCL